MKQRFLVITGILISVVTIPSLGQSAERQIVNQPLEWFGVTTNTKLSKRLSFLLEGQFRYAGTLKPMQYQVRTALEINVNDHFSIVPLGYVHTWNYAYGKQPATYLNDEHRIWQQVTYKHSLHRTKIDHRLRFEERFIEAHSKNEEGLVISEGFTNRQFRIRYRANVRIPLSGTTIEPKTYFLNFYDEAFISWGKKVTYHEPDQNRLFGGIGYQVNTKLSTHAGFLYQMLIKSNGLMQENNLGIQVQVNYNFDLTKL